METMSGKKEINVNSYGSFILFYLYLGERIKIVACRSEKISINLLEEYYYEESIRKGLQFITDDFIVKFKIFLNEEREVSEKKEKFNKELASVKSCY